MKYIFGVFLLTLLTLWTYIHLTRQNLNDSSGVPQYEVSPLLEEKLVRSLEHGAIEVEHSKVSSFAIPKSANYGRITKEYFRCRGSSLHSPIPILKEGKVVENIFDCGGSTAHSLPIRNGQEFIYPVLLELLNYIQQKTHHQVVITSGHRCPQHNRYVTARGASSSAKHMIGAAVDFYVVGLEKSPEKVLKLCADYFAQFPVSEKEKKLYTEWKRSEKDGAWYNKEVYLKWIRGQEGRDLDNIHPFPFFSLQVRFDRDLKKEVVCTPKEANEMYRY